MSLLRPVQPGPVINFHFLPSLSLSLSHTLFSPPKSYMTPVPFASSNLKLSIILGMLSVFMR